MYRYESGNKEDIAEDKEEQEVDWVKKLPTTKALQPEKILDKRLFKKTRGHEHFKYLVKWKDQPISDATWMTDTMLQRLGSFVEELMERSP